MKRFLEDQVLRLIFKYWKEVKLMERVQQVFFESGSELILQATPDKGWNFLHWLGDETNSSTNPSLSITIDSELSITAEFQPISYNLSITETDGGETSGAGHIFMVKISQF